MNLDMKAKGHFLQTSEEPFWVGLAWLAQNMFLKIQSLLATD